MRNQGRSTGPAIISAGVLCFAASNGWADGYRNPPPTAEGIGKSGVNSAFVDDASAISYNPANLALQTNASVVVGLTLARTENTYSPPIPGVSFESDGDWNYLPNVFVSMPVGEGGLAFGLGITTPYGQGISWNKEDFAPSVTTDPVPYDASIMLVNINPTFAFKLGESVLLGVGADILYSELNLKALFPTGAPPPAPAAVDAEGEGDGLGVGGNIGLTWLPTEKQRIALTYRSRVDVEYEGDFKVGGVNQGDFETTVKYPNSFGAGYGIELTDSIQLETLVEWLQWSVNDTQTLKTGPQSQTIANNWDDTFTAGVGGSWCCCKNWTVRAGYAFIESPIPDATISPLLPDADRHALSVGLGYALGRHAVDAAYTYSIYDDRAGTPSGDYDIDSDLLGLTYSLSF